jgi:hypothetical protein
MSYTPNVIPYTVRELIEKLKEYPEWYFVENVFKVDCTSNQTVLLFEAPSDKYTEGYNDGYSEGHAEGYAYANEIKRGF